MQKTLRKDLPSNVERMLWAESMGFCMNPDCECSLINDNVSIADAAHIIEHSKGGEVSFDNLLLLCKNCHKQVDTLRDEETISTLKNWKKDRSEKIKEKFSVTFNNFSALKEYIAPLLIRNRNIFDSYGPETKNYTLWKKFESELIINNQKILLALKKNIKLLHQSNQETVYQFESHAKEFEVTRDSAYKRENLFPQEILSLFQLEPMHDSPPPTLGPIHNLIKKLREKYHVEIVKDPLAIRYLETDGEPCVIYIGDGPYLSQLLFSEYLYTPKGSTLRTKELKFFVDWLNNHNIRWDFFTETDLSKIIVNNMYTVQLIYEYQVTEDHINNLTLQNGTIVINMHDWNGAPFSAEASNAIQSCGAKIMKKTEFFSLCHKTILK